MKKTGSAQERFRLFDNAPLGVCVLKDDLQVLFWNLCLEDWTAVPRDRIIGTSVLDHFPHLNNPKYLNRLKIIFEGGPPTIFSSQLHRYLFPSRIQDGQMRIQHVTVTPVPATGGEGFYALFFVQDVTDLTHRIQGYRGIRDQALEEIKERKRAEEQLRKAHEGLELRVKERTADLLAANRKLEQEIHEREKAEEESKKLISTLKTIVYHMPEGVVLLDVNDEVILANDIGKKHLRILSDAGIGDILSHIAGRPLKDFLALSSDVHWHEVEVSTPAYAIFELGGRKIVQESESGGTVLVLKDVTEARILEERIHSQNRLAAVGQLAAGIAHDFNNILTGIIGFSDILITDGSLGSEDRQMVEAIMENGQRAAQLIRQILDFSRKSISEMKSLDLLMFLKEFSKFIRRTIPENIHISVDYAPGEYTILADPAKLQQVLANVALNARDAMPGGGHLSLSLARLELTHNVKPPVPDMPEGNWIVLSVSDTGTGITSEIMPHIFEPFFTTKEVGKGTGLGLSQVYGIVKQHEGFIDVKTEPGQGSTFIVYLPLARFHKETEFREGEPLTLDGRNKTVLIVEDNESVRNFIQRKLGKLGFKVLAAKNGREALGLFERQNDDVKIVISDVVMPEMGGIELGKILRKNNPGLKIIGLSGYPLGIDEKEMEQAGFIECIQKPFQGQTLIQAIRNALERQPNRKDRSKKDKA